MSLLNSIGVPTVAFSFLLSGTTPEIPEQENTHQVVEQSIDSNKKENAVKASNNNSIKTSTDQSLYGVDISSHQHTGSGNRNIDIPKAVDGGISYAFVKATEGTNYMNPHFRDDVIRFIEKDTPVGFYHYAKPTDSTEEAKAQARLFVAVTGMDKGVKTIAPVLDIEENKENLTPSQLVEWTHAFVNEVKNLTGMDVMIYTYPNFWLDEMGNTTEFSHLPLWIASYNNKTHPGDIPGGWETWTFWQYTSEGKVDGYGGKIDLNVFNGTPEELKSIYTSRQEEK